MGYRLEMSKIKYCACGGKLFGYVDNIEELESYKWLLNKGYIDGTEYWYYGFNPQIILNHNEFVEFIEIYKKEYKELHNTDFLDNKELNNLIKSKDDVLLEWW